MVRIQILRSHEENAKIYATHSLGYYGKNSAPRNIQFNNILKGKMGEEVVKYYFRQQGISFEEDKTGMKEPDLFDIKVGKYLIDVKTISKHTKHKALIVKKKSFDTGRKYHFYILVNIEPDWKHANILGYVTMKDVSNGRVVPLPNRDVYSVGFKHVKPIEGLAESFLKMQRGGK